MPIDPKGAPEDARIADAIAVIRDRDQHPAAVVNRAWQLLESAALGPAMHAASLNCDFSDDAKQNARFRAFRALRNFDPARVRSGPAALPAVAATMGARQEIQRLIHQRRNTTSATRVDCEDIQPVSSDTDQRQAATEASDMLDKILPVLTRHIPRHHLDTFLANARGASYRECARRFGISVKAVDHHLERARWKIAELRLAAGIVPADPIDMQAEKLIAYDAGGDSGPPLE